MESMGIVETFDVIRDRVPGSSPCWPAMAVDELGLEGAEETLGHRIVPTIAFPAHGANDAMFVEHGLVRQRRGHCGRSSRCRAGGFEARFVGLVQ